MYENKKFLGEKYEEFVNTIYRVCKKCYNTQEFMYDSKGGAWYNLNPQEIKILLSKIDKN